MPLHEVNCPCGRTPMIYRAPCEGVPKFCNMACRRLFYIGKGKQRKYNFTSEMDAEIRKVYQEIVDMSGYHRKAPVKTLAKRFGLPRYAISNRAAKLGVRRITKKESNWSERELKILERQAHKQPEVIERHLKKAGFNRSVVGIALKRKRMHLLQSLDFDSAGSLASCLGIDVHSVIGYIKKGLLKAGRRGTKKRYDHWMIKPMDIRNFIIENVSILDFRKIDKFWLVDLLAGGSEGLGPIGKSIEQRAESIEYGGKRIAHRAEGIEQSGKSIEHRAESIEYGEEKDLDEGEVDSEVLGIFEEAQGIE